MGEIWSVSQLTKESGANAFEPRASNHFMQSMNHHGDGKLAVLYKVFEYKHSHLSYLSWSQVQRPPTACRLPLLAMSCVFPILKAFRLASISFSVQVNQPATLFPMHAALCASAAAIKIPPCPGVEFWLA
jgi:hypothetical protein